MRLLILLAATVQMCSCTARIPADRYVDIALAELDALGVFDTSPQILHEALTAHTLPTTWLSNDVPARVSAVAHSIPARAGFALPTTREHLEQLGYPTAVGASAYIAVAKANDAMFFEVHLVTHAGLFPVAHHGAALVHLTSLENAKLVSSGKYRQDLADAAMSPAIRADTNYRTLRIERRIAAELTTDPW